MQLFKDNLAVGITAALAATILAPVLMPIIAAAGRPLAKSLVKGGVILYEKGRETVAGAGEVMEDLIAEVRSEMEQPPRSAEAAGGVAQQPADTGGAAERGEERAKLREAGRAARPSGDGAQM